MAKRTEVCEAVAAVCQAQREVAQDAPGVVTTRARARVGEGVRQCPREPEPVRELGEQRGARARYEPVGVRGDFYLSDPAVARSVGR